ncbi:hypothetical protein HPB50_021639 [Hyalomma asiaticum]|uniref:Uncharacterized protein n=1 Tax=Hyalomma asiaticum TaxID=266040 RepID=A0ACB7TNM4_HYAAI|nr:hypothetical protein HPB50_021639 [Hyalomma asiaticum]
MQIDFSRKQRLKLPRRCNGSEGQMHLSEKAIERVAAEFEDSQQRREANTYEEYIATLRSIMRRHMTRNKNPTRHTRKPWWDKVAQAWQARREANRAHHRGVKTEDPEKPPPSPGAYARAGVNYAVKNVVSVRGPSLPSAAVVAESSAVAGQSGVPGDDDDESLSWY